MERRHLAVITQTESTSTSYSIQDIGKTDLITVQYFFDRILPAEINKIIASQRGKQELYGGIKRNSKELYRKVIDMSKKFLAADRQGA